MTIYGDPCPDPDGNTPGGSSGDGGGIGVFTYIIIVLVISIAVFGSIKFYQYKKKMAEDGGVVGSGTGAYTEYNPDNQGFFGRLFGSKKPAVAAADEQFINA